MKIKKLIKPIFRYFNIRFKYYITYLKFKKIKDPRFNLNWQERYPIFNESEPVTSFDRHYVYHTAWAIRHICSNVNQKHIDVSSSLYFVSALSAFKEVEFYDIRPPNLELSNLSIKYGDLTKLNFEDSSVQSLSCMHTIEHIGLGRYGDQIDYDGDLKAIKELVRVLENNGFLYIVVPISAKSTIAFNAHRIYEPESLLRLFNNLGLTLIEFSIVPDSEKDGHIVKSPSKELLSRQKYACGCFYLTKK